MKKLGYEGIGQVAVTVGMTDAVNGGAPVCMQDSGVVRPCGAGEAFCGIALNRRGEYGTMQVKGFVSVRYSGQLAAGWAALAGDGSGGVCQSENGSKVLVMQIDQAAGTAVICL